MITPTQGPSLIRSSTLACLSRSRAWHSRGQRRSRRGRIIPPSVKWASGLADIPEARRLQDISHGCSMWESAQIMHSTYTTRYARCCNTTKCLQQDKNQVPTSATTNEGNMGPKPIPSRLNSPKSGQFQSSLPFPPFTWKIEAIASSAPFNIIRLRVQCT